MDKQLKILLINIQETKEIVKETEEYLSKKEKKDVCILALRSFKYMLQKLEEELKEYPQQAILIVRKLMYIDDVKRSFWGKQSETLRQEKEKLEEELKQFGQEY